jgi:lipoprotein-anchoring transpeptidase ErfK/SrfK
VGNRRWIRRLSVVFVVAIALTSGVGELREGERASALAAQLPRYPAAEDRPLDPSAAPREPARSVEPASTVLVRIPREMPLTARPGGGRVVGSMPAGSRFYDQPLVAWVMETTPDGRFGRVPIPYSGSDRTGWLRLRGLETLTTRISVVADLSEHRIEVRRGPRVLLRAPTATGAPISPTPPGRYFVTDRVPFPGGGQLGTFAFGISGIQTRLPPGWSGGDQLAIHGTNAPSTIGTSASAGCLRVSERVLQRLRPLLRPGTPVVISR